MLGSWAADKGHSRSDYLSQPISSSFGWLVFDIAGGGPGVSLEIVPLEGAAIQIDLGGLRPGWHEVLVEAPHGPFRLHATDRSEHGWIAFSLPRELAAGGYFVRRICSANFVVVTLGLMILFAGLIVLLKGNESAQLFANTLPAEIPREVS